MSNEVIAVLRVIHIVFGTFWMGATVTLGFFLLPVVQRSDPTNGQFGEQLVARTQLVTVITAAGLITTLAGGALYGGIWAGTGFSGPPRWFAIGGYVAVAVLILAVAVKMPTAYKLRAFTRALAAQSYPLRPGRTPSGRA